MRGCCWCRGGVENFVPEMIIDQYCVKTDRRSGIVNDPNRGDAPQYILRLIAKVITVSLKTVEIVASLPKLEIGADSPRRGS